MWLILQQNNPDDFVIATGKMHTVREFVELAFKEVGMNIRWEGKGVDERGIDTVSGNTVIRISQAYFRPVEVEQLCGNPAKAKHILNWNPTETSFESLVKLMIKNDMELVSLGKL